MGFQKNIAFAKLGDTFSELTNQINVLSSQIEEEKLSNDEISSLTFERMENLEDTINKKLIDVIGEHKWSLDTPYSIDNKTAKMERSTLGTLVETLIIKFEKMENSINPVNIY